MAEHADQVERVEQVEQPAQASQQTREMAVPPAWTPLAQPSQVAAAPALVGTSDLPATRTGQEEAALAGPSPQGGVSWEEVRKGQPPRVVKNPDQRIWSDRFTSELQMVNMPGGRWQPVRPLFVPE